MRLQNFTALVSVVVCTCALNSNAAVIWDETTNGDLSGNRLVPTALRLSLGHNDVFGSVQGSELDYFTITLPPQTQLQQLVLQSYASTGQRAFIGIQQGSTFTEPPPGTNVANLHGWTHFGPRAGNVGTDILDNIGVGAGAQGFVPPISPGPYKLWVQLDLEAE